MPPRHHKDSYFFQTCSCAIVIGLLLSGLTSTAIAELKDLSAWSSPIDTTLPSQEGPVRAMISQVHFTWSGKNDMYLEHHDVTAVTVPSMNLYWLGTSRDQQIFEGKSVERLFFIFNHCIVGVSANGSDVLKFYLSAKTMTSPSSFQEVDNVFQKKLSQFGSEKLDLDAISVPIERVLGDFPFTRHPDARGEPAPNITKIDVNTDTFTIYLAGGNNNSVTAVVTFNAAFEPMKATLRGKVVFPK